MISIFVAITKNNAIGKTGGMPWYLPRDLKHFKELTTGHPVIMGRNTYESIPEKFRPLPDRTNIIVTRQEDFSAPNCLIAHSIDEALAIAQSQPGSEEIFIIGGGEIYKQSLGKTNRIYLTSVDAIVENADTFFPELKPEDWNIKEIGSFPKDDKNQFAGTFYIYDRKSHFA